MIKKTKENLTTRAPIVVVLGHIDHGKSSLLEAIKDFKITAKESGGITQHIGAYQIEENDKKITFLDTPGHEAFSQMRSRGAKVADIAILVIDAAEGVKPQTKEAILHIKEAGIPVIVALNKIDKPDANPEKVKRELAKEELMVESLGGEIPSLEVSAKTKKGIKELLEIILLVAEMENLKVDFNALPLGVVIESSLDPQRGPISTIIMKEGILRIGDIVGTDSIAGPVRNEENWQGEKIKELMPGDPGVILGFEKAARIGEEIRTFKSIEEAREHIKEDLKREVPILEVQEGQRVLNLILKADVLGSLEAIEGILANLPQEKVILKILKSTVGNVNESDLKLAAGSRALVLGFRVKIDPVAKRIADRAKVRIIMPKIIYELVEEVRGFMERIVAPEDVRNDLGKLKILAVFLAEKSRQIIGGRVIEGEVKKGALIEVFRNEEKIGRGRMINLQRNKKDINSVQKGEECGILYEGDVKIEEGDILLFYTEEKIKGQL